MPPTPPRPTGTQYANALGMTINNDTQRLEIHQDGPQGMGVAAFAELIKEFDNVPREETEKWLRERGAVVFQQQKEDIITCTVNAVSSFRLGGRG
jgi:hypothetical protein